MYAQDIVVDVVGAKRDSCHSALPLRLNMVMCAHGHVGKRHCFNRDASARERWRSQGHWLAQHALHTLYADNLHPTLLRGY